MLKKLNLNKKLIFGLLVLTYLGSICCYGQSSLGKDSEKPIKTRSLSFYPIIYYSPETRMAYGGTLQAIFRHKDAEPSARPSSLTPVFIYTQNRQVVSTLESDHYFKDERYHLISKLRFTYYPNVFYGIGHQTLSKNKEDFTSQDFQGEIKILRRLNKEWYIGLQADFLQSNLKEIADGGLLDTGNIPGIRGGLSSGLSLLINLDTRDHVFYPTSGMLCFLSYGIFGSAWGSDYSFHRVNFDFRTYVTLFNSHVLALQNITMLNSGNPPFQMMARMGGSTIMRGYYEGRYRDRHMSIFQMEYRIPVYWKIGIVGFFSCGTVAHDMSDFSLRHLKHAFGGGFRYMFNTTEQINLRIDMGYGGGGFKIYFAALEAF